MVLKVISYVKNSVTVNWGQIGLFFISNDESGRERNHLFLRN